MIRPGRALIQSNGEPPPTALWGLLRRRQLWFPSWRAWLLLLAMSTVLLLALARLVPSFLSKNAPLAAEVMVVEGWLPDFALRAAKAQAETNSARMLYVTGGPLEWGAYLTEFKNYADLGAATLVGMGLKQESVKSVPAPLASRDRTFTSAMTLKRWLDQNNCLPERLNVVSLGPHSRRTQHLFQLAFGKETTIGVISVPDQSYSLDQWWQSSQGIRAIISESLGYIYTRLFFRVPAS